VRQAKSFVSRLMPLDSLARQVRRRSLKGFFILLEYRRGTSRQCGPSLPIDFPEVELQLHAGGLVIQSHFVRVAGGRGGRRLDLIATGENTSQEDDEGNPRHTSSYDLSEKIGHVTAALSGWGEESSTARDGPALTLDVPVRLIQEVCCAEEQAAGNGGRSDPISCSDARGRSTMGLGRFGVKRLSTAVYY
jgi:hypothetical protein